MMLEIDLNPHSFVAFMTIAAGVSYIFFNSRTGFGVVKLLTVLFLFIPFILIGNSLGHGVDLIVGTAIGFFNARPMRLFNPFTRFKEYFSFSRFIHIIFERPNKCDEKGSFKARGRAANEEAARRQEQAKRERQNKQREQESNSDKKPNNSSTDKNKSQTSSGQQSSFKKTDVKSELEKAYEVLGLTPASSYAEAKHARNKLMSLYHPDKLSGLPEGRRKQAEEEAKQINAAWKIIRELRSDL